MTALQTSASVALLLAVACALAAWWGGPSDVKRRWRRWHLWRRQLDRARRAWSFAPSETVHSVHEAVPAEARCSPWHRRPSTPRLIFLGDAGVALADLLTQADPQGSARPTSEPPQPEEMPFWRWWRLSHLWAIEMCPPPLLAEPPQDLLWLHAQRALVQSQPTQPLDGMVWCVSPALLRSASEVSEPVQRLMAHRLHQTARHLQQPLPVHLLLTGLQDLPGYTTVREAMPASLLHQALGWRPPSAPERAPWPAAQVACQDALHSLRLALIARARSPQARYDIHHFFQSVLALLPRLQPLHELLQSTQPSHLRLEGLYLCAAGPKPAFVRELFDRVLPHCGPAAPPVAPGTSPAPQP